jgi:hypothetical protein
MTRPAVPAPANRESSLFLIVSSGPLGGGGDEPAGHEGHTRALPECAHGGSPPVRGGEEP